MIPIAPINDMLIVKRIQPEEYRSASGIVLPPVEESSDTPYQGVVMAAGPGKPYKPTGERIPMQVKVGDVVIYSKNLFQEFKLGGDLVVAFGQDSVLGVIEEEPTTSQPMNLYP